MSKKNDMLRKIFDIRIRTLFKNRYVAADFINGILFYENTVIHYDDISLSDSNLDSHLPHQNITRERERDNIYLVNIDGTECLIGIEHQSQIDQGMFQRTREYDEMNYLQQFNLYRSTHQMIKGVMTFVVYYGQKKWKAPRTYEDMMKPMLPALRSYMNVASYPLIEMRNLDPKRFHSQELKELIVGLRYLYNQQYDKDHDITISHDIAVTIAALTKNTQIYEKVKEEKIDMCQAIRDYGKENLNKGKAIGRSEGINIGRSEGINIGRSEGINIGRNEGIIQTLIKLLKSKLGHLSKDTLTTIHSCTQEQLDSLTIHIFDINSEKDILHYLQLS